MVKIHVLLLPAIMALGVSCKKEVKEDLLTDDPDARRAKTEIAPGQYIGVTMGFDHDARLGGKTPGAGGNICYNLSIFKSTDNDNDWWDNIAEEIAYSGVDFVAPTLRGYTPNNSRDAGDPRRLTSLVAAMDRRGLSNAFKIAIFDDNPASWTAARNLDNGDGYDYTPLFDCGNTANYKYIWDYDIKATFTAVPDAKRFKINGRPLIMFWSVANAFCTNQGNGNLKKIVQYVRAQCQASFGFNPYIVVDPTWLQFDQQCNDPAVIDAVNPWFNMANPWRISTFNNVKVGTAVPGFRVVTATTNMFIDANHGQTFITGLGNTANAGALITLVEGFTDWPENTSVWRSRDTTYYDYPNQRINILRRYTNKAYGNLKVEAEGCDYYNDLSAGNSGNTYRDGNIDVVKTGDANGGWHVTNTQAGEWLEWRELPLLAATRFQVRYSSNQAGSLRFIVDGVNQPVINLPVTGNGSYATADAGVISFAGNSLHTVRLQIVSGNPAINYFNIVAQ